MKSRKLQWLLALALPAVLQALPRPFSSFSTSKYNSVMKFHKRSPCFRRSVPFQPKMVKMEDSRPFSRLMAESDGQINGNGDRLGTGSYEPDASKDGRAKAIRQVSKREPEKMVALLLEALRTNVYNDGKTEPYASVTSTRPTWEYQYSRADDGLALLYLFSTIDPWKPSEYFGVKRDLGQFERFRLMMYSDPFKHLINHAKCEVLASVRPKKRHLIQLLRVIPKDASAQKRFYYFFISLRRMSDGPHKGHWMPEKFFPTTHPETLPEWN